MTMMRNAMGTLVLAVALVGGCGASQRVGESLQDTVDLYNDSVRWGRFPAAATHVPPEERTAFADERDELAETLRITDFELVGIDGKGDKQARVHVKYTWFDTSEDIVRETHSQQRWERRGKAWLMVGERRMRGPEMPGLDEPAAVDADGDAIDDEAGDDEAGDDEAGDDDIDARAGDATHRPAVATKMN